MAFGFAVRLLDFKRDVLATVVAFNLGFGLYEHLIYVRIPLFLLLG
jgi:hypothetical protein